MNDASVPKASAIGGGSVVARDGVAVPSASRTVTIRAAVAGVANEGGKHMAWISIAKRRDHASAALSVDQPRCDETTKTVGEPRLRPMNGRRPRSSSNWCRLLM